MINRYIDTPLGLMRIGEMHGKICTAAFGESEEQAGNHASVLLDEAERQIHAYFAGRLRQFTLPIQLGGTSFEQDVLRMLLDIPYAATVSYAEIARLIGRPRAARAVGRACAKNPILVIVPCHRVVSSDGKLTGFAAGIDRKQKLITLERSHKT